MSLFYLIRHGRHDFSCAEERGFIGHGLQLAPLTPEGVSQANTCSQDPRLSGCRVILSSPYTRAMQTAAILSKNLGIEMEVELDLREQELDRSYRVRSLRELNDLAREEAKHNGMPSPDCPSSWEPRCEVKLRVMAVLRRYQGYEKIIVVCHGMVVHLLTGVVGIPNCSIHEYRLDTK